MITTTAIGSSTSGPASILVASMPFNSGMRMSNRHTSGRRPSSLLDGVAAVRHLADHLDAGLRVEDHAEPGPHELLIVGDQHPDRHVGTVERGSSAVTRQPMWRHRASVEAPTEQMGALRHTEQTVALGGSGIAAVAVVGHRDSDRFAQRLDADTHRTAPVGRVEPSS